MNKPVIKQLGGPGTTVTNFNPETGMMDLVRGTKHFTLEAGELAFLLAHLHTLKDDIYEVRNRAFYQQPQYDADCSLCFHHVAHDEVRHWQAIARNHQASR